MKRVDWKVEGQKEYASEGSKLLSEEGRDAAERMKAQFKLEAEYLKKDFGVRMKLFKEKQAILSQRAIKEEKL